MKALRALCAVGGCTLALHQAACGQTAVPDQALAASVAAAQAAYDAAFVGHPQLYNGPEYLDYTKRYHTLTGHPYFIAPGKQPGSVYYNNHYFTNLRLAYDEVTGQLVISPPGSPLTLRLLNERVRYFTLADHRFVRLEADSASGKVIGTGYYEVLLDSSAVQVLARRTKDMQERMMHPYIDAEFSVADKLFIRKGGRYYAVASKSSVTRLFSDHSKEIQQYLQAHKLRFKKAVREAAIVQLAAYYSSLPPR